MRTDRERRALGMDRAITRRDFINGVAVGTAAAWMGFAVCRSEPRRQSFAPNRRPSTTHRR